MIGINVKRLSLYAVLAVAIVAVASGCSSTSKTSEAPPGSGSSVQSSGALAADKALVAQLMQPPHAIVVPKLSKVPPRGKTVALVDCPVPGCKLLEKAATPAARLLGWKVQTFDGGLTPEAYVAGVEQAIQSKPDYLMITALHPNSVIAKQLADAQAKNIPVWEVASSDAPEGAVKSSYFGPATFKSLGTDLAKWVTADSNGAGKVVLFNDPSAASYAIGDAAFLATLSTDCPGCSLNKVQYSSLDIGKSVPSQIISYLQRKPNTQYIISTFSGAFLGVPQALQAAGLNTVKLNGGTSIIADYQEVKQFPNYNVLAVEQTGGYYGIDALARISVGDRVDAEPTLQRQFVNRRTVSSFDSAKQWTAPDISKSYASAWGVTIPPGFVEIQP